MMVNGKTRAAIVAAGCTVIMCVIAVAGWYAGHEARVAAEAVRAQQIDDNLAKITPMIPKFAVIEQITQENRDNIASLVRENHETNQKITHLTEVLLAYMQEQQRLQRRQGSQR